MARPQTCHNPPPTSKDKLAERAPTKGNGTFIPTSAISYAFTLAPAWSSALVLHQPDRYMDKDLQQATKLALESFI